MLTLIKIVIIIHGVGKTVSILEKSSDYLEYVDGNLSGLLLVAFAGDGDMIVTTAAKYRPTPENESTVMRLYVLF